MRGTSTHVSSRRAGARSRASARSCSNGPDAFRWDGGVKFFAPELGVFDLTRATREQAKPPSHARMVLRRFRKEVVLAGFAAEAQAPMVVTDKTELSTAIRTAVFRLGHDALLGSQASARRRISLRRLTLTPSALRAC